MMEKTMIRTQIRLTEEQSRALKALAARRGVPVAELIRQSVDNFIRSSVGLDDLERRRRALAAAGKFHSGKSDVAVNHDDYLAEAYFEIIPS
jgi:predicted DNA-binding protein